jgi:hypothetical protein
MTIEYLFDEVRSEYERSVVLHGEQSMPICVNAGSIERKRFTDRWRALYEEGRRLGMPRWEHILMEEVAEVFSADSLEASRRECIQVANVALKMAADLDVTIAECAERNRNAED